ncbi:MAG: OmpA family protein [Elusimicrobia bacterium]|nr:OmpA family protein [Elusimicrobiota bacterium]
MKKNSLKIKKCVVSASLFLTLSMPVFGKDSGIGTKPFSIGPRATYYNPKDAEEGQWYGGAQARLHLSPSLGLEGSIDFRRNSFNSLTSIKTYPVQVSLLEYLMPGAVWSPFLLGGVGWYYTRTEGPNNFSNTTNRFGLHVGAGLETMLTDNLSLDGSYRYVLLESVESKDINALNKTYDDNGSMVTIALNFLFSFPEKSAHVQPVVQPTPKAEIKPEPKPVPVVEPNVIILEKLIVLDDTHFKFDTATLTEEGTKVVIENTKVLQDNPEAKIRIAGYASASGTEEYNQKLSERRAKAVEEILIKDGGIAPERLTTIGYGKTRPAEYEPIPGNINSKEAHANMRVLFEIIVK